MSYVDFVFAGLASGFVAACFYLTLKQTDSAEITTVDIDVGIAAFCATFIAAMLAQHSNLFP
jgi:uncharacterized membrane protein